MSNKEDKLHHESLTALVINALEFNAVVVSYATQVLAQTGGAAVKQRDAKRVTAAFESFGKSYTDKYVQIIKDIEKQSGIKDE